MVWSKGASEIIYEELRQVSAVILRHLNCHTEPHKVNGIGKTRTRRWRMTDGVRRYKGIIYHYTGGVADIGLLRWANCTALGNKVSSWHVTVLDRVPNNIIGEVWSKIDDELRILFPVPTIIMADFRWGTWHGNWTNNVTLGVENRNAGYHGYHKVKNKLVGLNKRGITIGKKTWEDYTREQIIANINVGRLANAMIRGQLDPDWVMTHQCIWAKKQDCGPLYPIHLVREAIFDETTKDPHKTCKWLKNYKMAPDQDYEFDGNFEFDEFNSREEPAVVRWLDVDQSEVLRNEQDLVWAIKALYALGFNTGDLLEKTLTEQDELRIQKMVRWFQRSTEAFSEGTVPPHGIVDEKTMQWLRLRLKLLGHMIS